MLRRQGASPMGEVSPTPPWGGSPYQRLINSGKFHPTGPPQKIKKRVYPPGGEDPPPGTPPGGQISYVDYTTCLVVSYAVATKQQNTVSRCCRRQGASPTGEVS